MTARIIVHPDQPVARIAPELYGHFAEHLGACVDEGIWVGEDSPIANLHGIRGDVVEAMRRIRPAVLRWPGGCFADDYHWEDGIGPRDQRPRRVNLWWVQAVESNAFGTHEFIQLCQLIGAQPYLAGNLGSGSPREMRDWVEYCNFSGDTTLVRRRAENGSPWPFNVRYWGVGNEAWGCGGSFCPEDYAGEYKRYANYLHDMGDAPLYLIACGPDGDDEQWARRFFERLGRYERVHGFAAHYYAWNRDGRFGSATEFSVEQWYGLLERALGVERLIERQRRIMDEFDPDRRIGLIVDEWGTWHPPTPGRHPSHLWQQNTLRDALAAAITLDVFNRQAEKVAMANIAQLANVLQAMVLTEGDRMVLTPTYHVFDLYQAHQGSQSVRVDFEVDSIPAHPGLEHLLGSASVAGDQLTLSVVNPSADAPIEAEIDLGGARMAEATVSVLSGEALQAHNTFDKPNRVVPETETIKTPTGEWRHLFEPASVTVLRIRLR